MSQRQADANLVVPGRQHHCRPRGESAPQWSVGTRRGLSGAPCRAIGSRMHGHVHAMACRGTNGSGAAFIARRVGGERRHRPSVRQASCSRAHSSAPHSRTGSRSPRTPEADGCKRAAACRCIAEKSVAHHQGIHREGHIDVVPSGIFALLTLNNAASEWHISCAHAEWSRRARGPRLSLSRSDRGCLLKANARFCRVRLLRARHLFWTRRDGFSPDPRIWLVGLHVGAVSAPAGSRRPAPQRAAALLGHRA